MPAGAEEDDAVRTVPHPALGLVRPPSHAPARPPAADPPAATSAGDPHGHHREHHHEHILIEPDEDRWRWRRKIRQNPRQLFFYRAAVGVAGLFFIAVGLITGPLPGPGGIPLVLLGLAIWSSEFEWAHRLMQWFKLQLHRFRQWTRPQQVLFWIIFFSCCGLFGYAYLLVLGIPTWMPNVAVHLFQRLPGVH